MTVVADTLIKEYIKQRNQLRGAEKRLAYAFSQERIEADLIERYGNDLLELEDALVAAGGKLPPEDMTDPVGH